MNALDTVRNNKNVISGIGFGIVGAALLVGGYKIGSHQTSKAYVGQINNLTKQVAQANQPTQSTQTAEHVEEPVKAETKPETKVKVKRTISAPVTPVTSVAPVAQEAQDSGKIENFKVQGRIPVTEISNDLTSPLYTTPGVTLEDAEGLINGQYTVGEETRFPTPEGGLWAAGRMIWGNDEDGEIHRKAVETAMKAKEAKTTSVVEPDLVESKPTKKRKAEVRARNRAATQAKKHPMGESDI